MKTLSFCRQFALSSLLLCSLSMVSVGALAHGQGKSDTGAGENKPNEPTPPCSAGAGDPIILFN